MLKSGVSLPVVQKVLGHRDIKTTQIYAKVVDDLMREEMGKLNYGVAENMQKASPNPLK
jgi:site-specific recombinase XerD